MEDNADDSGAPIVDEFVPIANVTVPWGGQQIELQQLRFAAGGPPLLRVRIREGRRFTIFDIDAASAQHWGRVMADWGAGVLAGAQATLPEGEPKDARQGR